MIANGRPAYSEDEVAAAVRVLKSGWHGAGPECRAFEEELRSALNSPSVVLVNSCTSALVLSLKAAGVGPGDEVVLPSLTWCADANAVVQVGGTPVFCDIDEGTLSVSPESIQRSVSPRTRAVVVVHFAGRSLSVEAISSSLGRDLPVVEDAAHAFGALFDDGTPVGSSGNLTCFSFYANKNLSTVDGGAVSGASQVVVERLIRLRQNGVILDSAERYASGFRVGALNVTEPGYKMGYNDVFASMGRVQLRRQPEFAERRLKIARIYSNVLEGFHGLAELQEGLLRPGHARHLVVVRLGPKMAEKRNEIVFQLRARGIAAAIHYPPLHREKAFLSHAYLPITEALAASTLTMPIGGDMTDDEAQFCAETLAEIIARSDARGR